jgi:hypothetical protein
MINIIAEIYVAIIRDLKSMSIIIGINISKAYNYDQIVMI